MPCPCLLGCWLPLITPFCVQDKVKEKIDASQGGSKDELESERKKVRERMQEIRTKQNEIKAERQELLDQLRALNASMKKKVGVSIDHHVLSLL